MGKIVEVTWKKGQKIFIFESAKEILEAHEGGRIEFNETEIVVNSSSNKVGRWTNDSKK